MPGVKAPRKTGGATTKKDAKTAKKPAPKAIKKVTMDDIWAGFDRFQKKMDEEREARQKEMDEEREARQKEMEKEREARQKEMEKEREARQKEMEKEQEARQKEMEKEQEARQKEMEKEQEARQKEMDEEREALKEYKKANAEAIRILREAHAETEKNLNRAIASTEKTLNKAIGGLSNTMGALVENFMTIGLPKKFKPFGFTFDRITTVKWADGENNLYTEIDGLLENGSQAMAVEVKTTLRNEDVEDHLQRMERVRKYADLRGDKREFLSAIAATIVSKSSKEYALKKGLFVIEPAGEDVKVTKPVSARVW